MIIIDNPEIASIIDDIYISIIIDAHPEYPALNKNQLTASKSNLASFSVLSFPDDKKTLLIFGDFVGCRNLQLSKLYKQVVSLAILNSH